MSSTFYKALGFVVWKGGIWYARRRYGMAAKWIGAGGMAAAAIVGAIVARRRNGQSG